MKKALRAAGAAAAAFGLSYLACCYLIPGWRIKLEADGWTYFLASLRSLAPVKLALSGALGTAVGGLVYGYLKKK